MSNLFIQFSFNQIADAQKEFECGTVKPPVWMHGTQITGTFKNPSGKIYHCGLLLSENKNVLQGVACSCNPFPNMVFPPSASTCIHVIALICAYEQNPSGVLLSEAPSSRFNQEPAGQKSVSSATKPNASNCTERSKKLSNRANPSAGIRSDTRRKVSPDDIYKYASKKKDKEVRDETKLQLDPKIQAGLNEIAKAFDDQKTLAQGDGVPDLIYDIRDTEPGWLPDLNIYQVKDGKKTLVPPKSPLWLRASVQQRHINAVRKMVLPGAGRDLDYIENWIYCSLWFYLLKTCLSTGKCYFGLNSPPLRYGPDSSNVMFRMVRFKNNGQYLPIFITEKGAPLLRWAFPYYVDRKAGCAGEAFPNEHLRWFRSFWKENANPASPWSRLAIISKKPVDPAVLPHFPFIAESLADSARVLNRTGISNLRYTLGVGENPEVPELTAWVQELSEDGNLRFVPISWEHVREDGSATQQFIATSVQMFLKHTTMKEISDTSVCTDIWLEFLRFIIDTKTCYWQKPDGPQPLRMGPHLNGYTLWVKDKNHHVLYLGAKVESADEGSKQSPKELYFKVIPWFIPMYLDLRTQQIGFSMRLPFGPPLMALRSLGAIPQEMTIAVSKHVKSLGIDRILGNLSGSKWKVVKQSSTLMVSVDAQARTPILKFGAVKENYIEKDKIAHITIPDCAWVANCVKRVKELGFEPTKENDESLQYKLVPKDDHCWRKLQSEIKQLRDFGIVISKTTEEQLRPLEIAEKNFLFDTRDVGEGWFSMSLAVKIGDQEENLLPILRSAIQGLPEITETAIESLNEKGRFIAVLSGGRLVSIPFDRIKFILLSLNELIHKHTSSDYLEVRVPTMHALSLLTSDVFSSSEKRVCEPLTQIIQQSQQLADLKQQEPPVNLKTELRDYQKTGLYWLDQISKMKIGGILADEMGLGKTVQVIAKIALDKESTSEIRQVLIVCPASLIGNWTNELSKFCPDLQVMQYTGAGRAKLKAYFKHSDIVLTTYQFLLRDQQILTDMWWHGVFLDEAQTIKNSSAAITGAVKELVSDYKICMTGTPIENHLGELWSLFDFLIPGLLGNKAKFTKLIRKPAEEGDVFAAGILKKIVAPFVLRRLKEDVLQDLPEKIESIIRVELTDKQLDLYEVARLLSDKELKEEIANKNFSPRSPKTVEILTRLRQVCLHPALCKLDAAKDVTESAKFKVLFERLDELLIKDRKLLIFSQYVEMLELISEELKRRSVPFLKLVGDDSIDNRTRMVKEFQESQSGVQVFLISLLAGGVGLNLTRADTVIIYDPWWNPAKESQAIDRAHRIGQNNPVFVFRMIAAGTIEERMLELKAKKLALANLIYDSDEELLSDLTEDDIRTLLAPVSKSDDTGTIEPT